MKKSTIILAFLLTVATGYTFANGTPAGAIAQTANTVDSARNNTLAILTSNSSVASDNIGSRVNSSFKQDFKNAELISSEVINIFTKLTFRMNDVILLAYYSENGELIATVHNILSTQLPINLLMDLKKNYRGYWITELFELDGKGQNAYYISLENANTKLALHSNEDYTWEVYQHADKK